MNNEFEKLLAHHDYETIISLTIDRDDHDALLARFIAYAQTGQDIAALTLIDKHFDSLTGNVKIIFPLHVSIIKQRNDKLLGFKVLARYQELPYTSIEVEEAMHEFEQWLYEVKQAPSFDLIKWRASLENMDRARLEKAIVAIPRAMIQDEVATIKWLLDAPYPQAIRYMALNRLIDAGINMALPYGIGEMIVEVIPAMLDAPLTNYEATEFIDLIKAYRTGPSEIELALQLLSQYAIAIYPLEPPYEDGEHLLEALFGLVKKYLGLNSTINDEVTKAIGEEIEASLARL